MTMCLFQNSLDITKVNFRTNSHDYKFLSLKVRSEGFSIDRSRVKIEQCTKIEYNAVRDVTQFETW